MNSTSKEVLFFYFEINHLPREVFRIVLDIRSKILVQ